MTALEYYIFTLLIFACLNCIAALGFNIQFGQAGIINFGIILLVAVGAYMAGIAAVNPAPAGGFTHYLGGFGWGFPWDVLFGTACAAGFSFLLGLVALRRLRHDYLALSFFAILQGMQILVNNDDRLFNGYIGISGIPGPWDQQLSPAAYQVVFLGIALASLVATYFIAARLSASPLGRAFRAVREDEEAASSLGKISWRIKMVAFVVGGTAAGLSGALQAVYASGWSSTAWAPEESLALLAAIIVGGRGRNLGVVLGVVLVQGFIIQGSSFLPQIGSVSLLPALQTMSIGLLLLVFLWFRPEGILPEQKERFEHRQVGVGPPSLLAQPPTAISESASSSTQKGGSKP